MHYIYIISNTFEMYDNFSKLSRKTALLIFFWIYRPSHHKILDPTGPVANEILVKHWI